MFFEESLQLPFGNAAQGRHLAGIEVGFFGNLFPLFHREKASTVDGLFSHDSSRDCESKTSVGHHWRTAFDDTHAFVNEVK